MPKSFVILFALTAKLAFGYYEKDDMNRFSGRPEMSGIRYDSYAGFEKKWRLVTVRFRTDSKELRFTYANPVAWEALARHSKNYPDGSVFAKMSIVTSEDPRFVSSAVPDGASRTQYMVRDKKKYSSTAGWGYSIFDARGRTYPEDPALQVRACAACHNLVAESGYVFSEPMKFLHANWSSPGYSGVKLRFKVMPLASLPVSIQTQLPKSAEAVAALDATDLSQNAFQGTLDELTPALIQESRSSGRTAIFYSAGFKRFNIISAAQGTPACGKSWEITRTITLHDSNLDPSIPAKVITTHHCE